MRKLLGVVLSAVLLAAGTQVLGTPPAAVAAPVSCSGSAKIFYNRSGTLYYYEHFTPATGTYSWTDGRPVGYGFNGLTVAGPDGLVYYVNPAGELRRYRFNGTAWTENGTLLGTGWGQPPSPPYRIFLTVDFAGRLLAVDGNHVLRVFDASVPRWDLDKGIPLDVGWTSAPIAAGDNVFYRNDGGALSRYRYDPESQRLNGTTQAIGVGFGPHVFSPGGDVLYMVASDGSLYWYRYDADTGLWANGGNGKLIGNGWSSEVTARSNTCSTRTPPGLSVVTPEPIDPNRAFQGAGNEGDFTWAFITAPGRAQQVVGSTDGTPSSIGTQGFASNLTSSSTHDTKTVVGIDDVGRAWITQDDSTLFSWAPFGQGMTRIRLTDTAIGWPEAMATDPAGKLWWRQQYGGAWTAWRQVFTYAPFTGFLDVADTGLVLFGVASAPGSANADYWFSIDREPQFGPEFHYGALPSAADFDQPTVVNFTDGPALVARNKASGQPYLLLGSGNGFSGATWTPLPALPVTVDGPMAADERLWGKIAVAARGSDGYVYVTSRETNGTYQPWQRIGEPAANAPALTDGGGFGMHLGYRGTDGKLYHFVDTRVPPPPGPLVFTGGGY